VVYVEIQEPVNGEHWTEHQQAQLLLRQLTLWYEQWQR